MRPVSKINKKKAKILKLKKYKERLADWCPGSTECFESEDLEG